MGSRLDSKSWERENEKVEGERGAKRLEHSVPCEGKEFGSNSTDVLKLIPKEGPDKVKVMI